MKTILVHGVSLATVDQGKGPPILLVHGFPLDHSMWNAQIAALSAHWRVIAPDLRGFGHSEVTPGTVTMEQLADDLTGLLDALGVTEPIVYCGLSMGGYIGWEFFRKHGSRLRGMILCDTRAVADSPETRAARQQSIARLMSDGAEPVAQSMIPKLLTGSTLASHPALVSAVHRMIVANNPQGLAAAQRGMAERPDSTALLSEIRCPCLVVVGKLDTISTLEEMRAIASKIPNVRLVTIAGAGHLTPMEQPFHTTSAIEEFLESLP